MPTSARIPPGAEETPAAEGFTGIKLGSNPVQLTLEPLTPRNWDFGPVTAQEWHLARGPRLVSGDKLVTVTNARI